MPFLVVASLFIGAWISIVLHESSHAVAGHLANLQIREFRVGLGPTALHTRLLGTEVRVGAIPLAGCVKTFPQLSFSKPANLVFVAAGPLMDIVWLGVLSGAMTICRDAELAGTILAPATFFQIMMVFGSVLPHYSKVYGQRMANDMLAFWTIAWKERDTNAAYRQGYLNALRPYMSPDDLPWQPTGQSDRVAFYLSKPDLKEEDIPALEAELAATTPGSERLLLIETAATKILTQPGPPTSRLNAYLDRLTEMAVAMSPGLRTLKGTRGAALARLGRHVEALNVLAEADSSDDYNRCLNAAFRALAHHHAGRKELAAAELETSIAILRSYDWAGRIGQIVSAVRAEIGYPSLADKVPAG
ncbi:site-2 protease family protein [Mesorhizobium sp. B2-6-2]|uniref:site-2 protease family protein n=1 Tax=Mesorhizobium sp. B2-6-2 TaxID=2589915 RepID=UPI0015E3F5FE|nr:site-2 protease family protein [Mesorhizobium sp. B2-6-2]